MTWPGSPGVRRRPGREAMSVASAAAAASAAKERSSDKAADRSFGATGRSA